MNKEVVWIMGSSATGKETFIREVTESNLYKDTFGWSDKRINFSSSSIDNIGHSENDPVLENRNHIISEVTELIKENDIVLIKWQFVDSEKNRLDELKKLVPQAQHKIIYLKASSQDLTERLPNKVWWNKNQNISDWICEEQELLVQEIQRYQDNFYIVDKSNDLI